MITLIKNGYIIDPVSHRVGIFDLLIEHDRVRLVEPSIGLEQADLITGAGGQLQLLDASGKYVMPGFIDLHVHLREPGFEYKETIQSGSMAAAAGGFTSICAMPNTKPAIDSKERIEWLLNKARESAQVNVLPVGAVTKDQEGTILSEIDAMAKAGAVAISEDGKSVMNSRVYRQGMLQAAACQLPVFAHCEDKSLVGAGVINAGRKAQELGLEGISNAVEDIIAARDILLAKETGVRLHLCHCSTKDSVRMIALAKQEGLAVTGEICPHHFTLSDEDIIRDDANFKMNPPLRSPEDVQALKEALRDNIIDVIATDHAPHSAEEKSKSMREAPFGIVGLETAFSLTMSELVRPGYLTPTQMVEKLSVNPARILGLDRGCIGEGKIADLIIADPAAEYTIDRKHFYSKGKNTPFHGRRVFGRIEYTFVAGEKVYEYKG